MCGFVGYCNFDKNLSNTRNIISNMNEKIKRRGPDNTGYYIEENICLGHQRLSVIDIENGNQPITVKTSDNTYTIVYNGQIYNANDIRKELQELGFSFNGHSDTEVLLKAYILWGYNVVNKLNGIFSFAIWNQKLNEVFLARDYFGVKPLYYTIKNNSLIFASEVKAILAHPEIEPVLDKQGIHEMFGLGPAHTPGTTLFKDIHEIRPAHMAVFNKAGFHTDRYWKLESKEHKDDFNSTCDTVKYLLEDSIKRQLISDVPICTMLSGGLDSSIITAYANNYFKKNNLGQLNTFSVDYVDNDINFVQSDFQPNSDNYYIDMMVNYLGTKHHKVILDTPELAEELKSAMIARDFPGMADIDSSLLLFSREIKKDVKVALSGECADEIFGGYPWFFREDALSSKTFPWSIGIQERQELLNPDISAKINLREYIDYRYEESLNEVKILDVDTPETAEKRKIFHLNFNWFMQTLLDRSDKMGMYNGLELRVPFCDHRLVQYVWNIPWETKALNGREKGLLRYIVKDLLPEEIINRKKSPYPKTHNPNYLEKVKDILSEILENENAPIKKLLNEEHLIEILNTNGESFKRPWFGQLMTGPQLMAYLCQVNMWLEEYNPKIEL